MTKTTTLRGFIAIALLSALALAPLQFASANTGESDGGFFSNLRERQVANRQNVKVNLLQMLSSEETSSENTSESSDYTAAELASITYQFSKIADQIESRMLVLENQGSALPEEARLTLALARTKIEGVTLQLIAEDYASTDLVLAELASARDDLQSIIAMLKNILAPQS